jgi:DNA-binding beta-propeller fold protein YncE
VSAARATIAAWMLLGVSIGLAWGGCVSDDSDAMTTLMPPVNPLGPGDPLYSPQPHRERPRALCVAPDGGKAWVMLAGTEDEPGEYVAVVDVARWVVTRRLRLGASPYDCALDPSGRYLVVTLRYSDRAVVLDARSDAVVARVPVPFYTEGVLWRPDGRRVYLANRWKDSVLAWDVETGGGFRVTRTSYDGLRPEDPMGVPAGTNPGPMAMTADGRRLFVGAVAGGTIAVIDGLTGAAMDADGDATTTSLGAAPGISWIDLHSPVGGLAVAGGFLYVADIGRGHGLPADEGRDLDGDGLPGDGTANVVFQDVQNEIGVVDTETLREVHRYTSDSICCNDYRDVDPERPERGLLIPAPDTWGPDAVAWLPPRDTWIVAGALPEAMVVVGERLYVAFSGSSEVQGFAVAADGALAALPGPPLTTGYNPKDIAAVGDRLLTADRLAESLSLLDPAAGPDARRVLLVGDTTAGPFPATDAEIGEALNEMTAAVGIDGDQTCVHCHRDNGAIARAVVMPLQVDRLWGARAVMAQRGLHDTRPWFFESAMDEGNFFPVLNEFARKENFCCEGLDPTVWGKYPAPATCAAAPDLAGCDHVLDCVRNPPPECAERPYAHTPFATRAAFIRDGALRLLGRDTTFGDVLTRETAAGGTAPIALDFEGVTRAIGLFMARTSRLLPNPNARLDLPSARRGAAIYADPAVGCAICHPLPLTTTASLPVPFSPFGAPVRFPPVVSPSRSPDGHDSSRVNLGFIATFPQTVQRADGVHFGATPLRGLWDRPEARLLHDGRARSLREALATPGHPVLAPGEVGFNERDGVVDTHGGTSHLPWHKLEDLIAFLRTL